MIESENIRNNTIEYCLTRLLMTRFYDTENDCLTTSAIDRYDTLDEALEASIGYGGGFSLPDEFKPYWFFDYRPSMICELVFGQADGMDTYVIPKSISKKVCLKIWNEKKVGQMTLF